LSEAEVRNWLLRNTDRDNFYLRAEDKAALLELERFLKVHLGPAFEGTALTRRRSSRT